MASSHEPFTVPAELFAHVEASLESSIERGMIFEMAHSDDPAKFWIAEVEIVCLDILCCRYLGGSKQFMCNVAQTPIYRVIRGRHDLVPPKGIQVSETLLSETIDTKKSIPEDSTAAKSFLRVAKIASGMKVELRNETCPTKYWPATVMENVGGRLLLQYDSPLSAKHDVWIFYTDPRIHPIGFAHATGGTLEYPFAEEYRECGEAKWSACIEYTIKADELNPYPRNLFPVAPPPPAHDFKTGTKLEAINPENLSEICAATVTSVSSDTHFTVTIDSDSRANNSWLCRRDSAHIFPVGWCEANGVRLAPPPIYPENFAWDRYLRLTNSRAAPSDKFLKPEGDRGFRVGMKLEAADPLHPGVLYKGTIRRVACHLLLVECDGTERMRWYACDSTNLFPIGWCQANNLILSNENGLSGVSVKKETSDSPVAQNDPRENANNAPAKPSSSDQLTIYFNAKCTSGPMLSKNKFANLAKRVGPGPLSHVLPALLNKVISAGYKPAKLLRDWEYDGDSNDVPLATLRAKLKTSTHHADVQIVAKYDEVPAFCKEICSRLQACTNLIALKQIDECPARCNNKAKLLRNGNGRRRRRRGLHFMTIRARERRAALEAAEKESGGGGGGGGGEAESANEEEEEGSEPSAPPLSPPGSPESSSDAPPPPAQPKPQRPRRQQQPSKRGRAEEARAPPPPAVDKVRTRGAKLPNFALQQKQGVWPKKDVATMYGRTCAVPRKRYSESSGSESSEGHNSDEDPGPKKPRAPSSNGSTSSNDESSNNFPASSQDLYNAATQIDANDEDNSRASSPDPYNMATQVDESDSPSSSRRLYNMATQVDGDDSPSSSQGLYNMATQVDIDDTPASSQDLYNAATQIDPNDSPTSSQDLYDAATQVEANGNTFLASNNGGSSNDPSRWSVEELQNYLAECDEISYDVANLLKKEMMDGEAFIMLNYDTLVEHLDLEDAAAVALCRHVGQLKYTHFCHRLEMGSSDLV